MARTFTGARAAFRLSRVALHLAYGAATLAVVYPVAPLALRQGLKQRWSRQLVSMLGVGLPKKGELEALQSGMLVSNHISWLDIFVINAVAPSAFVSKDDVKSWPLIGWLCEKTDTIFLERGSRRAAHRTAEHLQEKLKSGYRVAIFPEGTTSDGVDVLPFHSALIQPAVEAGCPVQPVALRYLDRQGRPSQAPAYIGDTSLWDSLRSIATAPSLRASPRFLPPVTAAGAERRHLAATLHRHIAHEVSRGE